MLSKLSSDKLKWLNMKKMHLVIQRYNSDYWSSQLVRKTFVDYFKSKDHIFVPSSSVIPKKQEGTYFVNSGMNQFKSIFTGTMESPVSHGGRVTNHQKCIRVGGKHNDLEDVGNDFYHHTFFEMLGNWSFNNSYSKYEACKMAWELLTEVYRIPGKHLYITYFHGNQLLNLPADLECKEIWKSIGIPEDHLLPFGMEDNFWSMGSSGPCGPCTEIHYCYPPSAFKQAQKLRGNNGNHLSVGNGNSFKSNKGDNGLGGNIEDGNNALKYNNVNCGDGDGKGIFNNENNLNADNRLLKGDSGGGSSFELGDCRRWVNAGREEVKEVWNLVFMEYDMHPDKSIHRLPQQHIDTGMGLERLTALLQHKHSNYHTDLFCDLLTHISTFANCPPYAGRLDNEIDRAYRVVADHTRMATVCISDGLMPGRKESAGKLRQIMYRCLHQLDTVLKTPRAFMASLAPLVLHSLVDAYPDMNAHTHLIREVMTETEQRYHQSFRVGRKMMYKAVKKFQCGLLSGEQIIAIQEGRFGKSVSFDVISLLAKEFNVQLDVQDYKHLINNHKEAKSSLSNSRAPACKHPPLNQQDVEVLKENAVSVTDDSYMYHSRCQDHLYTYPDIEANITAIKSLKDNKFVEKTTNTNDSYIVITDRTNLYGEAGGQESDVGVVCARSDAGELLARVTHVKGMQGYVGHYVGDVEKELSVGQCVVLSVDQHHRTATTRNHTATHLLHHSLHKVLGAVVQQGSSVKKDAFTFDFTSLKSSITLAELKRVAELIDAWVQADYEVCRSVRRFEEIQECKHIARLDGVYPSDVTVVSIGLPPDEILKSSSAPSSSSSSSLSSPSPSDLQSIELCGGTHVDRTGHLGKVVITNFEGSIQGNKRVTAVSAHRAEQAVENAEKVKALIAEVESSDDTQESVDRLKHIDKQLASSSMLLGKVEREAILEQLKQLHFRLSQSKNQLSLLKLFKELSEKIQHQSNEHCCVMAMKVNKLRSLTRCLLELEPAKPIFILSDTPNPNLLGLCYVPQDFKHITSASWSGEVCSRYEGHNSPPQGKLSKHHHISLFTLPVKTKSSFKVEDVLKTAESYAINSILEKHAPS